MSSKPPSPGSSKSGHVPAPLVSLSYDDSDAADAGYPSPQGSVSSPSSPTHTSDTSSMGTVRASSRATTRTRRSRSAANSQDPDGKEKRKRSRVTPEQLAHLERFFATDRSPTAIRRREISEMLGMQERQTQIWFQNRRAKAKLLDGKQDLDPSEYPPDAPPALSTGFDVELQDTLHEEDPITIIPCVELVVGTWRRVAAVVGKYDLVAYLCDGRHKLSWFICSDGCGFKMDIPFETIIDTKFNNASPGMGQATFVLSRPPSFFREISLPPSAPDTKPAKAWKQCADWTENMQATKVLQHDLVGAAIQLAHVLRTIASSSVGPSVPLYPPSYDAYSGRTLTRGSRSMSTPGLSGMVATGVASPLQAPQPGYIPPRRYSQSSVPYHESLADFPAGHHPNHPNPSGNMPPSNMPTPNMPYHQRVPHASPTFPSSIYPDPTAPGGSPQMLLQYPPSAERGMTPGSAGELPRQQVAISQTIARRSFTVGPGGGQHAPMYSDEMHSMPPISFSGRRLSASSTSPNSPTLPTTQGGGGAAASHPPSSWNMNSARRASISPNFLVGDASSMSSSMSTGMHSPQTPHGFDAQNYPA